MLIKEAEIIQAMEKIVYHYHLNICNRVSRTAILQLYLDDRTWRNLENFTEKLDANRFNGFPLDELYKQVAACARFAETARNSIETIKTKIKSGANSQDKIYRDISANNLPINLNIFADMVKELFSMLVETDKKKSGSDHPMYTKIRELDHVKGFLTGNYS